MTTHPKEDVYRQLLFGGRIPLPDEKFPRTFEERKPTGGYYIAFGLILAVWMITPLSCAYLVWFVVLGRGMSGSVGLTGTIFAGYALTEVIFAIYTSYLIRLVQTPSPPATMSLESRNALYQRILHIGLAYPIPERPLNPSDDPDAEHQREIYNLYASGQITVPQYHHLKDREYEEVHGIQSKRRVGKMTVDETGVIDAFVEDEPGEREARLREQIEGVVTPLDQLEEGLLDKNGKEIMLHPMDRRAIEFRERMRTWFNHAPWEAIRKQNVLIWLAWTCFNIAYDEAVANPKWSEFLQESLGMLEARTGTKFPDGFNVDVQMMRLTLDPVNVRVSESVITSAHSWQAKGRPLLIYALSNAINWWLREVVYPYQGMGLYREGDIEYLIRIPKGWDSERGKNHANAMPVLYLHGLGFGLLQSHFLIKHLIKSLPSHPLLIPLSPYTGQAFFHERYLRPWTRSEVVDSMQKICQKWGFWEPAKGYRTAKGGVSLLSHSNGSVAHGWILKDCPSLAKRNVFVDPVVFCLWEGDVCHSFCYRTPATALELLLYYFVAAEIGIAHYISRHFDWADNTLFFDEIPHASDPSRTAFFLGGEDIIIDAKRVRRYLERHGVKSAMQWDDKAGHGDGLSGESRDRVVMFAGTGSVRGWQGWLSEGRRTHSTGVDEWRRRKKRERTWSSGQTTENGDEADSDQTFVEDGKKDL